MNETHRGIRHSLHIQSWSGIQLFEDSVPHSGKKPKHKSLRNSSGFCIFYPFSEEISEVKHFWIKQKKCLYSLLSNNCFHLPFFLRNRSREGSQIGEHAAVHLHHQALRPAPSLVGYLRFFVFLWILQLPPTAQNEDCLTLVHLCSTMAVSSFLLLWPLICHPSIHLTFLTVIRVLAPKRHSNLIQFCRENVPGLQHFWHIFTWLQLALLRLCLVKPLH